MSKNVLKYFSSPSSEHTIIIMAASLLISCGLNERRLPALVYVAEASGVDGSFLISSIIGQQLKAAQSKIILVCLHHGFSHYNSAGMRMGYSLSQNVQRDRVRVVEFVEALHKNPEILTETIVQNLFDRIVAALPESPEYDVCIVLDDLSVLLLFAHDDLIMRFVRRLDKLREDRSGHISLVLKLNTAEAYPVLEHNLETLSRTSIGLEALNSGRFKEVDGRMVIKRLASPTGSLPEEKLVLYKVNDRNVKIFAKGEFGVK